MLSAGGGVCLGRPRHGGPRTGGPGSGTLGCSGRGLPSLVSFLFTFVLLLILPLRGSAWPQDYYRYGSYDQCPGPEWSMMCRNCCEYDVIRCKCPLQGARVGYAVPCCRNAINECDPCIIHPGCSIFENCKRCNNGTWGPRDDFFIRGKFCTECRPGWSGGDCLQCGGVVRKRQGHLVLESYPNNARCEWTLQVDRPFTIDLRFMMLSLEFDHSCRYDYVEVRDGASIHSRVIGRFCGNSRPALIQSSSNTLHVLFVSDGYKNFDGFFATFQESSACSSSPCLHDGTCVLDTSSSFYCACLSGYTGRRCENVVGCRRPPVPPHGSTQGVFYHSGARVTFHCDPGFQLRGARSSICLLDGTWSASSPQCVPVKRSCFLPPRPAHGDHFLVYGPNDVLIALQYLCYRPYKMTGASQRTCLPNNTWSGTPAVCSMVNNTLGEPGTHTDTNAERQANTTATSTTEATTMEAEPTEVHLTEVETTEVKPTDVETTEVKPTDVETTEVKPTEVITTEVKPTVVETTEVKPTDVEITEVKPTEVITTEVKPAVVETTEVKPTEVITIEVKPTDVETTEVKPTVVETTEVKPTEVITIEVKPTEVETTEVKPTDVITTEVKPTDVETTEVKPTEVITTEVKPSEGDSTESKQGHGAHEAGYGNKTTDEDEDSSIINTLEVPESEGRRVPVDPRGRGDRYEGNDTADYSLNTVETGAHQGSNDVQEETEVWVVRDKEREERERSKEQLDQNKTSLNDAKGESERENILDVVLDLAPTANRTWVVDGSDVVKGNRTAVPLEPGKDSRTNRTGSTSPRGEEESRNEQTEEGPAGKAKEELQKEVKDKERERKEKEKDLNASIDGGSCPAPPRPHHGSLRPVPGLVPETVEYSCNHSYALSGDARRACQPDGTWSGRPPLCVRACREPKVSELVRQKVLPPQIPSRKSPVHKLYSKGLGLLLQADDPRGPPQALPPGFHHLYAQIAYQCASPYYQHAGSARRTCLKTGKWSGRHVSCSPVCGKHSTFDPQRPAEAHWPWLAAIYRSTKSGDAAKVDPGAGKTLKIGVGSAPGGQDLASDWQLVCSGALLNQRSVVVAAHCVTELGKAFPLGTAKMKVVVGKHYRQDLRASKGLQHLRVASVAVHPNYDPLILDSDLAVVRLLDKARIGEQILPLCLPEAPDGTEEGVSREGLVTGWSPVPDPALGVEERARVGVVRLANVVPCEQQYARNGAPVSVSENMLCASHKPDYGASNICPSDTGGILVLPGSVADPTSGDPPAGGRAPWRLMGLVSFGYEQGECDPELYTVYTRVANFKDWIESHMR